MIEKMPSRSIPTGVSPSKRVQAITAIHVVEAIGLLIAIVVAWNPENPIGSLIEALFWVLLALLLLLSGWGLWNRRDWAHLLALVLHWPAFAFALILFPVCLCYLLVVPARGIAVGHVFALFGVIVLLPVGLLSGWIIRSLHGRTLQ